MSARSPEVVCSPDVEEIKRHRCVSLNRSPYSPYGSRAAFRRRSTRGEFGIMRYSFVSLGVLATVALTAAPLSQASAHEHFHGHFYGPGLVLGAVGAVIGAAAVIATAPFRAIAAAPVYAAPPPAPAYYAPPQQSYYAPPQPSYYAAPPVYYAPPPRPIYYAPPAYYGPPGGYYPR